RLYLAGSRVSFEGDWIELHQVLGVKTEGGDAGMALRPDWEPAVRGASGGLHSRASSAAASASAIWP
ncbi:MAG: hypothetical protein M3088_05360, partial [Actinomycetota bacterium]|nr:hypothetical protein [Actinomycetota bacterium]